MQKDTKRAVTLIEHVLAGIVESINKTSGLVAEAAGAADEQAADAREVLATVGRMSNLARQIAGSISENATGAQEISAAAQKMNQLTHQMSEAVTEQKHGGEMVVKAVEAIAVVSRQNLVAVEQMSGAAKSLAGESDALKQRVSLLQGMTASTLTPAQRVAALEAAADGAGRGSRHPRRPRGPGGERARARDQARRALPRAVGPRGAGRRRGERGAAERRDQRARASGAVRGTASGGMLGGQDPELLMFALQSLSRIGDAAAAPPSSRCWSIRIPTSPSRRSRPRAAADAGGGAGALDLLQRDLWLQLAAIDALGAIGRSGCGEAAGGAGAGLGRRRARAPGAPPARGAGVAGAARTAAGLGAGAVAARRRCCSRSAVVIDLHPDPEPTAARMEREWWWTAGTSRPIWQQLAAPPGEGDAERANLLRAAATVVVAAGIAELQPVLLAAARA